MQKQTPRANWEEGEIFVVCKVKAKTLIKRVSKRNPKDKLLEYSPEFLSSLEKAKEEYLKLGGLTFDNYLRRRRT